MTPREVLLVMDAAAWQAQREQERMISLAWHIEALHRAKRLPSLRALLRPRSPARDIPIEQRRKEFAEMKAAYDGHSARRSASSDQGDTR